MSQKSFPIIHIKILLVYFHGFGGKKLYGPEVSLVDKHCINKYKNLIIDILK